VRVTLRQRADVDVVVAMRPSHVLLATGSRPVPAPLDAPPVPVYGPSDAPATGGHVLVQDEIGRLAALLTAERLAQSWSRVTLVTSAIHPGEGEGLTTAYPLLRDVARAGVTVLDRARVSGFHGRDAVLTGLFDETRPPVRDVDAVVSLGGAVSDVALLPGLRAAGIDARPIGDARLPRDVTAAVRDAAETVWALEVDNS
jgi:hypothetical protein